MRMQPVDPGYRHPQIARLPEGSPEIWGDLERAHFLIGELDEALSHATSPEVSDACAYRLSRVMTPFRCLVLARIGRVSELGISPTRLAYELRVRTPVLAYHLRALEAERLIWRAPRRGYDERRVAVRLTWAGGESLSAAARVMGRLKERNELGTSGEPREGAGDQPAPSARS